jgi:hypothetical protein
MLRYVLAILLSLLSSPVLAQHQQGGHGAPSGGHSPYAGFEKRTIKTLSEQQLEDLRQGRGMGLALPAELNGYPGPLHVLELAAALGLSSVQKHRMEELYTAMKAETSKVGLRLIEQERALDLLFARRTVTSAALNEATAAIGITQAMLRNAHLAYHLLTVDILTPEQIERYNSLRGYAVKP